LASDKLTFRIVGWHRINEVKQHSEWFTDKGNGRDPMWFVAEKDLFRMTTFVKPNGEFAIESYIPESNRPMNQFYKVVRRKYQIDKYPRSLHYVSDIEGLGMTYPPNTVVTSPNGPIFAFDELNSAKRHFYEEFANEVRVQHQIWLVEGEIDERYSHVDRCISNDPDYGLLSPESAKKFWEVELTLTDFQTRKNYIIERKNAFVHMMRQKYPNNPDNWSPSPWMRLEKGTVFLKWVKLLRDVT
jgi:hypothetical protein